MARPLAGVRIFSLALNLPGPVALQRLRALGARCFKVEPPAGDPLRQYQGEFYGELHRGIAVRCLDLKTALGQAQLAVQLAQSNLLLTSFRPSALVRLGLSWRRLHRLYPHLSMLSIVGGEGLAAEDAGHDLTYQAANDLLPGLDLPATLYADMAGALLVVEAALALLQQRAEGRGAYRQVSLTAAAGYLGLPRRWGLTTPGGLLGGGHPAYRLYPCRDGRVAVAALEPHFAQRLCSVTGLDPALALSLPGNQGVQAHFAAFFQRHSRAELDVLGQREGLPWVTLT